jgi:hypothetical protein
MLINGKLAKIKLIQYLTGLTPVELFMIQSSAIAGFSLHYDRRSALILGDHSIGLFIACQSHIHP